ncbi:uncharacterized protein LOC114853238 isoform X3 [Betta splendens]|uniref:Uncharacterized protein LOC114853238 isoform X3 n=1 Tax=Betta splendens TaxID=158456 RepID=A0A9W2XRP6_BETSP|nr:uncharacterized protein LOC114853238 isoform X3 [Betta splendens]
MERLGNKEKRSPRMMTRVAVALLGLLSMGWSAPMNSCTSLIEPITISKEGILGRWLYIGGSSNLPGSRSLGRLLTSVWLEVTAAAESNVLNIIQTQRLYSKCSSLAYNVTFENSTMKIGRSKTASPDAVEHFKKQAECLRMPAPIMMDPNTEICPSNIPASEGLSALNSLLEAKTGHRVARVLDALFDAFVN